MPNRDEAEAHRKAWDTRGRSGAKKKAPSGRKKAAPKAGPGGRKAASTRVSRDAAKKAERAALSPGFKAARTRKGKAAAKTLYDGNYMAKTRSKRKEAAQSAMANKASGKSNPPARLKYSFKRKDVPKGEIAGFRPPTTGEKAWEARARNAANKKAGRKAPAKSPEKQAVSDRQRVAAGKAWETRKSDTKRMQEGIALAASPDSYKAKVAKSAAKKSSAAAVKGASTAGMSAAQKSWVTRRANQAAKAGGAAPAAKSGGAKAKVVGVAPGTAKARTLEAAQKRLDAASDKLQNQYSSGKFTAKQMAAQKARYDSAAAHYSRVATSMGEKDWSVVADSAKRGVSAPKAAKSGGAKAPKAASAASGKNLTPIQKAWITRNANKAAAAGGASPAAKAPSPANKKANPPAKKSGDKLASVMTNAQIIAMQSKQQAVSDRQRVAAGKAWETRRANAAATKKAAVSDRQRTAAGKAWATRKEAKRKQKWTPQQMKQIFGND